MWSLGCVAYEILQGKPPFMDKCYATLMEKIREASIAPLNEFYSKELRDFVMSFLQRDPALRPSMSQIVASDFFKNIFKKNSSRPVLKSISSRRFILTPQLLEREFLNLRTFHCSDFTKTGKGNKGALAAFKENEADKKEIPENSEDMSLNESEINEASPFTKNIISLITQGRKNSLIRASTVIYFSDQKNDKREHFSRKECLAAFELPTSNEVESQIFPESSNSQNKLKDSKKSKFLKRSLEMTFSISCNSLTNIESISENLFLDKNLNVPTKTPCDLRMISENKKSFSTEDKAQDLNTTLSNQRPTLGSRLQDKIKTQRIRAASASLRPKHHSDFGTTLGLLKKDTKIEEKEKLKISDTVLQQIDIVNREKTPNDTLNAEKLYLNSPRRSKIKISKEENDIGPSRSCQPVASNKVDRGSFRAKYTENLVDDPENKKMRIKYKKKLGIKFDHINDLIKSVIRAVGMKEIESCFPKDQKLIVLIRKANHSLLDQLGTAESIFDLFRLNLIELKSEI